MKIRNLLIQTIEAFLDATGETERQFGIDVVGDHKLVKRVRCDVGVTLTTIEKVEEYIAGYPVTKLAAEKRRAMIPEKHSTSKGIAGDSGVIR